ncbi:GNAT family N-acetyltransferase [Bradyrhizobium sp. U87765 SZCCT0131]|uniref:GNAT family N-acetyltransferase n=1 Tax=unclassified Bradyrhizobium TaxID=2631580 RepID=UPI001BA4B29A|nr:MULTISPECIES: GNAT family protein [unclassified Bradyrhizobium]MBR1217764.1 GNAT family N-acetyltransferase [Bradyrhizobium sp. U87765 SZCCT0131]MBR1261290.1 GNAT family N-acetyltransferase [Bradyrhizobium sp. U87765 SZCCT0134]MBR1303262.1 GNAT family N-acetyltransferase [Bradyrhizobium sp. U87765 SZCCT0110]MBR1318868.1 GNAT family N-acetyltransferase [Bradyrhizobium sp. U87765 SZCCT0109]MBR1347193.1 GNAT family N-acetyltransferase [Bradyrhizobium sp. U87765 SZCCT0048]
MDDIVLEGRLVRLEPLGERHIEGLVAAAADRSAYQWTFVPATTDEAARYVATARAWQSEGSALPFAIVRRDDDRVIGSTRFWNLERWAWPAGHPRHGRNAPDAGEIGHTWLARSAIRTGINGEAKTLLLTFAFETWDVLRVCLHTDARNERSRAAIGRLGATFEGTLRSHRLAPDQTPRDSARFSIIAAEWPAVRERLGGLARD